jgi:hypothetical protein
MGSLTPFRRKVGKKCQLRKQGGAGCSAFSCPSRADECGANPVAFPFAEGDRNPELFQVLVYCDEWGQT